MMDRHWTRRGTAWSALVVCGGLTLSACLIEANPDFVTSEHELGDEGQGSEGESGAEGGADSQTGETGETGDTSQTDPTGPTGTGDEDGDEDGDEGGMPDCPPGMLDCDDEVPGCETSSSSVEHCGSCAHSCVVGEQSVSCDAGECVGELVYAASADVMISQVESDTNFEGELVLTVSTMPKRDALIDFSVTPGMLPQGISFDAAQLALFSETTGVPFALHRVTQNWEAEVVTWTLRPNAQMQGGGLGMSVAGEMLVDISQIAADWAQGSPMRGVSVRSTGPGELKIRSMESADVPQLVLSARW